MGGKNLPTLLEEFSPSANIETLTKQFEEIAKASLYGGYFLVNDKFRIYLLDIEFYFHRNDGSITDSAMYRTNEDLPYFPKGSLCPNQSGIDVTFEDIREKKYRASFLIRGYKYDDGDEQYINNINSSNYNPRFLWEDLFGNATCIGKGKKLTIEWINEGYSSDKEVMSSTRVNVKGEAAKRPWRFSKKD